MSIYTEIPHQLDALGREQFRKDYIAEVKRLGGYVSDSVTFDEARFAFNNARAGNVTVVLASLEQAAINAKRAAYDAHVCAKPEVVTKRQRKDK